MGPGIPGGGSLITRRVAVVVLALAGLTVAGCSSGNPGASGHPTSSTDPKSDLLASVRTLATTTYAVTLTMPAVTAIGAVDPVAGSISVTAKTVHDGAPATIQDLTVGGANWAKIDIGPDDDVSYGIDPDKWLKLDPARITVGSLPYDQARFADAFDLSNVLAGVTSVAEPSRGHYSGRINLTGVAGVASMLPAGSGLGAAAEDLPFTAAADAQGRLTDFKVGGSDAVATFDFGISDYGAPTAVDPPIDDDVVVAPSVAYGLLRGDHMTP